MTESTGVLERLIAALERNNELQVQAAAGRERVLAAAETASTKATAPKATKPAAEKSLETVKPEPAVAAVTTGDADPRENLKAVLAQYLGSQDDKAVYAERAGKAGALFKNEKIDYGAETKKNASTLPAKYIGAVVQKLNEYIAETQVAADEPEQEEDPFG